MRTLKKVSVKKSWEFGENAKGKPRKEREKDKDYEGDAAQLVWPKFQ